MAREILFKAKRTDNGMWIEGYYAYKKYYRITKEGVPKYEGYKHFIHNDMYGFMLIDENTLCQYTGLTDKNGNKIWENDVVKGVSYSSERIGIIVWINELAGFGIRYRERNDPTAWENASILKCATSGWKNQFAAEVIGNIFDNHELLKEE